MSISQEELVLQSAVVQVQQDMLYVEVIQAALYKKVEFFGERPELSVQGIRWYVEVQVRNLNDETEATALCRVWNRNGTLEAVRVSIA